jgi:hypothetical protein
MGATDLAARHENRRRAKADGGQNGQQIHREKQLSGAEQALTDSSNSDREKNGGQGRRAADGTGAREHPAGKTAAARNRSWCGLLRGPRSQPADHKNWGPGGARTWATGLGREAGHARESYRWPARLIVSTKTESKSASIKNQVAIQENRIKIGVDRKPSSDTGRTESEQRIPYLRPTKQMYFLPPHSTVASCERDKPMRKTGPPKPKRNRAPENGID